jgi:hypothetical protein
MPCLNWKWITCIKHDKEKNKQETTRILQQKAMHNHKKQIKISDTLWG